MPDQPLIVDKNGFRESFKGLLLFSFIPTDGLDSAAICI